MQTIIEILKNLSLHHTAVWLALTYIAVMLAMAVDFVAGLRKAKQAGIATTSRGFKMTVEKATKYFLPMLCLSCIDIITSVILPAPDKQELRDKAHTFNVIVKNKDDIAAIVMQAMELMERKKQLESSDQNRINQPYTNTNQIEDYED